MEQSTTSNTKTARQENATAQDNFGFSYANEIE